MNYVLSISSFTFSCVETHGEVSFAGVYSETQMFPMFANDRCSNLVSIESYETQFSFCLAEMKIWGTRSMWLCIISVEAFELDFICIVRV